MTTLREQADQLSSSGHVDYTDEAQIPPAVNELLADLASTVDELREARPAAASVSTDGSMTRADALTQAREHVEAMSTGARGYQDGVKLADKVSAVDRFARFLMGETE